MPRREPPIVNADGRYRDRTTREQHGETGWYEWALRKFARYLFALGILGLLIFLPLQMVASWLPSDAPAVLAPALVTLLALLAIVVICALGFLAYRALWGDDGWVERRVPRHDTARDGVGVHVLSQTPRSR